MKILVSWSSGKDSAMLTREQTHSADGWLVDDHQRSVWTESLHAVRREL
jgi:hypothetical protein